MARTFLAALLSVAGLGAGAGVEQEPRPQATCVTDILARVPAESTAVRDRLAREILGLGAEGIAEIARQLVPAGAGNDVSARFALGAVAAYASRFGREAERAMAERALVRALVAAPNPEVKTFLLGELRLVAREEAVRAAAPYLVDAALSEPAAQLMRSVRSADARQALTAALRGATGAAQITIVKALGELGAEEANVTILPLASASSLPLRKAALAALAEIASPKSADTLTRAAKQVKYRYDASGATSALLAYARNLGEEGQLDLCERVCRAIIKDCRGVDQLPVSSAALAILADSFGYEALPYLLRAAEHRDRAYRVSALNLAERISGVAATRQWIARAERSEPAARADIVGMLGRRGDRAALPFLESSLRAREPEVRLAAADSLARVRKADAVADLLAALANSEGDEASRLAGILGWILDERHLDPLVSMLDTLGPAPKAAAIGVIAGKGTGRHFEKVLALTSDQNAEVRRAAFAALRSLAGPQHLGALLGLLESVSDPAMGKEMQQAIVRAASQAEPAQNRARPLLDAMKISSRPVQILELLPRVGGAEALRAVIEQFDQSDASRKGAAFRALAQWPDPAAAEKLYAICASEDEEYRGMAFGGLLRQVSSSSLPADQKLLHYRKILGMASQAGERRTVIRAMGQVKTFQSFVTVTRYLEDPELRNEAAASAMRIALPSAPGGVDGLGGTIVREGLGRVLEILSGPSSESDREAIRAYLAAMPKGEGFVPLFNGRDLSGWQGLVGNPITRAKMSPADLAAKQADANARVLSNWSTRDGLIVFNGKGDNLCTVKDYGDFEMLVDWRITPGGDSGIYLRGSPQVQIWDPARTDVGAQVGSGGLYNNQKNPSRPLVRADNPVGEWNTLRITMAGEKVSVFLNGVKVVDNVTMENYWDRAQPIFSRGPIELQAHGTDLAFRDIYVREIPEQEINLTSAEIADGFASLFNGRDLGGWVGNTKGYKAVDGALEFQPGSGSGGNLYAEKEYADFQFRFEFQLAPGANSGIGIRAPLEGDAAYVGMEIQVLDDAASVYANLQPYQYHGSVYGVMPARRGALKPAGEWNTEEIIAKGSHIRVVVNGIVVVDGDILEASQDGTMDRRPHPGLARRSGHIGFLSHDSVVRFRNVRIKDLSK